MQTSTRNEDRSSSRPLAATAPLAMPRRAFTRDQSGRDLSVVDGLVSVTERAWRLAVGLAKGDAGPVVEQ